jgi:hypothetical protein
MSGFAGSAALSELQQATRQQATPIVATAPSIAAPSSIPSMALRAVVSTQVLVSPNLPAALAAQLTARLPVTLLDNPIAPAPALAPVVDAVFSAAKPVVTTATSLGISPVAQTLIDTAKVMNGLVPASSGASPTPLFFGSVGPFNQANIAALFQMQVTDMQQAQTIFAQVAADAQKARADRWKIMQDTQTKIFEITQDVTVNKAKTADKAFNAMDGYIRG